MNAFVLPECPICIRPMLQSVVMSDGCEIHRTCGQKYFDATVNLISLKTYCPLQHRQLVENHILNAKIKHLIETTKTLDNYIIDLSDDEVIDLSDLIVNSPRMRMLLANRLNFSKKQIITELFNDFDMNELKILLNNIKNII